MNESIAFLGLGHMGEPMAANLIAAGYRVTGFDVSPDALAAARTNGIPVAQSALDAVTDADFVITMFQTGEQVIGAYTGEAAGDGLLAHAREGTLFCDCSTISVDDARRAHERAVEAGQRSIDAPVSGGVVGAVAGTLAFMVGGSSEDVGDAMPLLEVMGKRIVHCGGAGLGQAAKVCNNLMLGISMIGVSEAFVLGEKLGLSNQALFDVASNASGQCWSLTTNCPVPGPVPGSPANNDYEPGFAAALMAKDLGLAAAAISSAGVSAQLGTLAGDMYNRFAGAGGAGKDFSGIINEIRDSSTTEAGS